MQTPEAEYNRFRASRLSQVDKRTALFIFRRFPAQKRGGRPDVPKSRFALVMDRVLLAIEIVCAFIVAWIAVQYVYTVYFDTGPHRGTPSALPGSHVTATRTATATPTRFAELLPPETGGPGDAGTGTGANRTATPDGLSTPTPTFRATPTNTVEPEQLLPSRLRIPAMFLDSPVHEVTVNMGQWEVSPMDIGHHEGTSNPGEIGNVVLAGHRDINSALFRELDRLEPGDDIFVSNNFGEYHYIVRESMVVGPDHTEVMEPTPDRRLTLITCTPIGIDTQRLIVIATLDEGR
jgi:sortase A